MQFKYEQDETISNRINHIHLIIVIILIIIEEL